MGARNSLGRARDCDPGVAKGPGIQDSPDAVAITIIEDDPLPPEPEQETPEPEEPVEPEPVKPPPKPKTFKARREPPKAPEEPPAAAPETPVAFDNIVLTNDSEEPSSWA
ncbi:MAG: hypothetical protein JRG93_07965, partial [Deltaproteobacteria bacterium]|nr:hypothetical protein [Deltaproteobacteria bacterium]